MGQYSDAMTSYEHVMSEKPSVKAGQLCIVHLCVYSMYKMLLLKLCYTTTLIQHTILQQMFYVIEQTLGCSCAFSFWAVLII